MGKNIKGFVKDGMFITTKTPWIFFASINLPKASLDAVSIMKLAAGICGGLLVKDYTKTVTKIKLLPCNLAKSGRA